MFRSFLAAFLLFFGIIPSVSHGDPHDFQKNGIAYVWENDPNYIESKRVFLDAFVKCYSDIPLEVLRKSSREELVLWLEDVFNETYLNFKNSKNLLWLSAKAGDQVVGCLILEMGKYPEEIYLAHLAVDPHYQGQGIGSSMVQSLFSRFPEGSRFVVITRSANREAKGLYDSLGFTPSSYMHEGYSRELYTGFEFINRSAGFSGQSRKG